MSLGLKNYSDAPTRSSKKCDMSMRLNTLDRRIDRQTDRISKTISCSACIAYGYGDAR